jgi:FAD/FMN-containing dehydrogenase
MGLSTFEGEIYRSIDGLISDNYEIIESMHVPSRGSVGYNLKLVRADNGSMDLTPLFVGSQGTLGVIAKAVISTEVYKPGVSSLIFVLSDRSVLNELKTELSISKPLNLEYIDGSMIQLARQEHPKLLIDEIGGDVPAGVLVAEFSNTTNRAFQKLSKKLINKFAENGVILVGQEKDVEFVVEKLKNLSSTLLTQQFGSTKLVPGIDDAMVPSESIHEFLLSAEELFKKLAVLVVVHGRIGEGIIHSYPLIDLNQLGDRQKLLRLEQEYYKLVMEAGGSVVGEFSAGRTRGAYARFQLGDVGYGLMHRVKQIFDPYGILNPGVKIDVDQKAMLGILSTDFEIPQLYHN